MWLGSELHSSNEKQHPMKPTLTFLTALLLAPLAALAADRPNVVLILADDKY